MTHSTLKWKLLVNFLDKMRNFILCFIPRKSWRPSMRCQRLSEGSIPAFCWQEGRTLQLPRLWSKVPPGVFCWMVVECHFVVLFFCFHSFFFSGGKFSRMAATSPADAANSFQGTFNFPHLLQAYQRQTVWSLTTRFTISLIWSVLIFPKKLFPFMSNYLFQQFLYTFILSDLTVGFVQKHTLKYTWHVFLGICKCYWWIVIT